MFQSMLFQIREGVFRALTRVHVQPAEPAPAEDAVEEGNAPAEAPQQEAPKAKPTLSLRHKENDDLAYSGSHGCRQPTRQGQAPRGPQRSLPLRQRQEVQKVLRHGQSLAAPDHH